MKLYLESILGHYLEMYSDTKQQKEIRTNFVKSGLKIFEQRLSEVDFYEMFLKDASPAADTHFVTVYQPSYIYFFMITYFYYLNKLVEEELKGDFGNDWREENIGYDVCVNKSILDNFFGSKEILNELLYVGGILQKNNEHRKAQISTHSEEILPVIQQKLEYLEFKMKSYFVVVQTYPTHIQLTLHQVVKISSSKENSATIIIQDQIIQIEDVYDTLCKKIWANMSLNGHIEYCNTHKDIPSALYDFGLLQNYSNIYQKLKSCVVKLVGEDRKYVISLTTNFL